MCSDSSFVAASSTELLRLAPWRETPHRKSRHVTRFPHHNLSQYRLMRQQLPSETALDKAIILVQWLGSTLALAIDRSDQLSNNPVTWRSNHHRYKSYFAAYPPTLSAFGRPRHELATTSPSDTARTMGKRCSKRLSTSSYASCQICIVGPF